MNWFENLFHLYIYGDLNKCSKLLIEKKPKGLIKFFSGTFDQEGNSFGLDSLRTDELWMSNPKNFNDPFDCAFNSKDISEEIFKKIAVECDKESSKLKMIEKSKEYLDKYNQSVDYINKIKNNTYVCCFSDKKNSNSILMWSHYANCHKGFCVEYDSDELYSSSNNRKIPTIFSYDSYLRQKDLETELLPVFYREKIYFNNTNLYLSEDDRYKRILHMIYAFVKSNEWKYEKEWRLVTLNGGENKPGIHIKVCKPKKVIIGCKASPMLRDQLKNICKERNIALYQMEMKPDSFKLVQHRIPLQEKKKKENS